MRRPSAGVTSRYSRAIARILDVRVLPALVVPVAALLAGGYPTRIASLLAAAVWLTVVLVSTLRPPPRPSLGVLALVALAALSALSAAWGHVGHALAAAVLPALFAGLLYAAEWAGRGVLDPLRAAIVLVAALGIGGRLTGLAAPSPEPGSVRMAWPIGYANGLGLLCAIGVVLCAGTRRWWPGAVVCATALVWTFSRAAIVGCVAALILLALMRGLVPRRVALAGGVVLAVVAVLVARPAYQHFQSPAPDTRNAQRLLTVSGHGRAALWRAALRAGARRPVAGVGAGTYGAKPHSLELQTFAELGVLGLALLGVFLADVLRRRGSPEALAALAAWVLVSAVDWDWQLPAVTGAAMIAAGAARRR